MYVFNISSRQQKIAIDLLTLLCHRGNAAKPQSLTVYQENHHHDGNLQLPIPPPRHPPTHLHIGIRARHVPECSGSE